MEAIITVVRDGQFEVSHVTFDDGGDFDLWLLSISRSAREYGGYVGFMHSHVPGAVEH